MAETNRIVVIGAGQAGGSACVALRQFGYEGDITLVGDEAAPPYQRPPLSKAYFKGEMTEDRLYVKPLAWYEEKSVTLKLGESVSAIDRTAKQVTLSSGETLPYDKIIIATGSRPRLLPVEGSDLDGVLTLRTLACVQDLQPR